MTKRTSEQVASCAACEVERANRICMTEEGKGYKGCPTLTKKQILEEANREYEAPRTREFSRQASIQEAACYVNRHQRPYVLQPSKTRIVEICEFAQRMGYQRLGLAFCAGLANEAAVVEKILQKSGFAVISVLCKAGRTPKEQIGLTDEDKIYQGKHESMCNAIYQARILNHEKTDLNVLLGLCVGHDSLFFRFAEAPTTVLAVKDRVTGHNPLVPIYLSETYYQKLMYP